jgi:NADH:ubiquinone oxidoreductase subunit 6 (subunit J)
MQIIFVVIAGLGLAAALGTVLARNLVHAALFLVAFFFTVACQFVLLEADFLAALQVLVYIGAVAIILMFGIMLTRNIKGDEPGTAMSVWPVPGLIVGLGLFLVLAYGISFQLGVTGRGTWAMMDERPSIRAEKDGTPPPRAEAINNMAKVVGDELLTRFVIAFEVAGLLLTAALVGAIALAHRDEQHEPGAAGTGHREAGEAITPEPPDGVAVPASPVAAGRGI